MTLPKDPIKREAALHNIKRAAQKRARNLEWIKKISGENNHNWGKRPADKTRKLISDALIGRPRPDLCGEKHPMFGKRHPKESNIKRSNAMIGKHDGVNNPFYGHRHTDKWCGKHSTDMIGDKNPQWNGGSSFEPYPTTFNKTFKQPIREYYGNICINCGKTREENGQELTCHDPVGAGSPRL